MSIRPEAVSNAIKFLSDPKVQNSSFQTRIAFLENKGLSESEIQTALAQTPQGVGVVQRDWKDVVTTAMVAGGTGVGIYHLAKRYLTPLLDVGDVFAQEGKGMEESLKIANDAVEALKDETRSILEKVDGQSLRLDATLESLTASLKEIREMDAKRQDEFVKLKDDVENIKNLIPKMVERSKESQNSVLQELQTEIKSLKSLLMNRKVINEESASRGASPTLPIVPAQPKIPSWQMADD
jgi:peroxin-14